MEYNIYTEQRHKLMEIEKLSLPKCLIHKV